MNKDIRPMTDEERQRAKEKAMANKEGTDEGMSDHIPREDVKLPPTISEAKLMDRIVELEAKLNKAIDALEKVQAFVRDLEPHADQGHTLVPALREACETLKEIKGETDE